MGCLSSKEKTEKYEPPELTEDEVHLLEDHTGFSRSEIMDWYDGFISDCPTGKLDKKSFALTYKKLYPKGKPEKFCDHLFRTFDADGDGTIDFKEFLIATGLSSHGDIDAKLNWTFQMYDMDHSGTIERRELARIIQAIYDLNGTIISDMENSPRTKADQIFDVIQPANENYLTKMEFINGLKKDEELRDLLSLNQTGR
ncbi:hypothetical protein SNEBB_000099 [Seison nebaliae]|nr:hypothetical protein SNEBB_000099 [Seison nebaliae]